MSGRISLWTNLLICVVAILGHWGAAVGTGLAAQHRKPIRQDGYQPRNDRETVNTAADYHGPVKVSSSGVIKEEDLSPPELDNKAHPPIPSLYRAQGSTGVEKGDVEDDEPEAATRYNFDRRGPSSYKLKYGGLGKRKLGSSSLRYGGLGKRLSGDESTKDEDEAQERNLGNGKHLFETAYFFLAKPYPSIENPDDVDDYIAPAPAETTYDAPADQSDVPVPAVRQQRSRMGPGMRYAGLGKRRLQM